MGNTVLLLQPNADVAAGSGSNCLVLYVGPDVDDAATTAALPYDNGAAANQTLIDAANPFGSGTITINYIGSDAGNNSFSADGGWTLAFSGNLGYAKVPPILAFDGSGLTSGVTPSATYTPAGVQSYVAASAATAAVFTFNDALNPPGGTDWTNVYTDTSGGANNGNTYFSSFGAFYLQTIGGLGGGQPQFYQPALGTVPPLYGLTGWTYGSGGPGAFTLTANTTGPTGYTPYLSENNLQEAYGYNDDNSVNYADINLAVVVGDDIEGGSVDGIVATWVDGVDAVTGQPQIDTLVATASGGSLTIGTEYGSTAAIPWVGYADSAACCAAVASAINAVLTANSVGNCSVAVTSGQTWTPTSWPLSITLPSSEETQAWTIDGSGLTAGIAISETVQTAGGGAGVPFSRIRTGM